MGERDMNGAGNTVSYKSSCMVLVTIISQALTGSNRGFDFYKRLAQNPI